MRIRGCNEFRLAFKRGELDGFDDGVMVGPGSFKPVGEEFDGRGSGGVPSEKTESCDAGPTDQPENALHDVFPRMFL